MTFSIMKAFLAVLFYLSVCTNLVAQTEKTRYRVPYDSDITKLIPVKDRFLLENFRKGIVYFRTGIKSQAMLNYSFFHSQIQFIDAKNDTLLLADNDFVRRIVIDDLLFYYHPDQGHLQEIGDFNKIRLCRSQQLIPAGTEHPSTYGSHFSTASISSYPTFTELKGVVQPFKSGHNVVLAKETRYFWMDQNDRFSPASKANLTKIFPRQLEKINHYFKENNVNLSDEQDLVRLLEYCKSF
jgi:hypothetical protein